MLINQFKQFKEVGLLNSRGLRGVLNLVAKLFVHRSTSSFR